MVVALRTGERGSQPDRTRGVYPVDENIKVSLVFVDAGFLVEHRVAVEPGRHLLRGSGVGEQVAGDLLDSELIERHVLVQGANYPVAITPDRPGAVFPEAVGVGVARQIEPGPRPALAEVRRGEQAIHQALVRVGTGVGQEFVNLFQRRGKPDKVE